MSKSKSESSLAGFNPDRHSNLPVYRQIYEFLRLAILEGRIRPQRRLPPTRDLAKQFGVSRTTVLLAYEHLFTEGYIEGKMGSGTFVSATIPDELLRVGPSPRQQENSKPAPVLLSARGKKVAASTLAAGREMFGLTPFRPGLPALREFPFQLWFRVQARQSGNLRFADFGYGDPLGYAPLREAIADHLRLARAVKCKAAHILVVNGSQQALALACRILTDPGERAWMENPGYQGAREAMTASGLEVVPVAVDAEGLDIASARHVCPDARLAYVSPSHQYPLGITMSIARRLQLLEWAAEVNAWIFEDDYDSEFRYAGRPLSSLQGIDQHERVIYIGTFSKVLFPGLRLGYMVIPDSLVDAFVAAKAVADRNCPVISQATLAEFIAAGHFGRHIRRMRLLYQERQACLLMYAGKYLGGELEISAAPAGLHVTGWLRQDLDDKAVSAAAGKLGVQTRALSTYAVPQNCRPGLVLGYAPYTEAEIQQAMQQLARAIETVSRGR